ncbi:MAG: TlyA family RNA methyltransferase [Clostridia bacterium]|nr:TlyA family RNA methyltransferase [Clostridia bacterium]
MRADLYLVSQGAAESRTAAKKLIEAGVVTVDGRPVKKVSEDISDGDHLLSVGLIEELKYVSRGGLKLEAALKAFPRDLSETVVADIGASTGGFTDCLLTRGVARVYCIDSGHGQLHPRIAADPRVRNCEGVNARTLTPKDLMGFERTVTERCEAPDGTPFAGLVDGAVMDVSFISQTLIHPTLASVIRDGGFLYTLIKPQFEAGASALGKGGVVKKESDRKAAVDKVLTSAEACGFTLVGMIPSPIQGGDGNTEYIAYFTRKNRGDIHG